MSVMMKQNMQVHSLTLCNWLGLSYRRCEMAVRLINFELFIIELFITAPASRILLLGDIHLSEPSKKATTIASSSEGFLGFARIKL